MLDKLKNLFTAPKIEEDEFEPEKDSIWTEHLRIVLAIAVVIAGALFMWWIVA